jgi:aryl-alcohol dehydrogenase
MITEALVIAEPGAPMRLEEVLIEDEPRADEVMVQMKATGVCHTDLNFQNEKSIPGLFPAVLGHEGMSDRKDSLGELPGP